MPGKAKVLSSKEIQTVLKVLKKRSRPSTLCHRPIHRSENLRDHRNRTKRRVHHQRWHTQYSQNHQTKKEKYRLQQHPNPPQVAGTTSQLQENPRQDARTIPLALPIIRQPRHPHRPHPRPQHPHRSLPDRRYRRRI